MQELPLTTPTKKYMCLLQHRCASKIYNKVDYDFTSFAVSQWLGHVSNSENAEQYICASCDKRLKETTNENPSFTLLWKVPKCSNRSKLSESTESKTWICVHMLLSYVIS